MPLLAFVLRSHVHQIQHCDQALPICSIACSPDML